MEEISLIEFNKLKEEQKSFIVLYYLKNNIISELASFNLEKINTEIDIPIYKISLSNNHFDQALPVITIYEKGCLKSRLIGFHNLSYTRSYIEKIFV